MEKPSETIKEGNNRLAYSKQKVKILLPFGTKYEFCETECKVGVPWPAISYAAVFGKVLVINPT